FLILLLLVKSKCEVPNYYSNNWGLHYSLLSSRSIIFEAVMRVTISLIIFYFLCVTASASENKELINLHLDSSRIKLEEHKIDRSLYHTMRAEELVCKYYPKDDELQQKIEKNYVDAFVSLDDKEHLVIHLNKLLKLCRKNQEFNNGGDYERAFGKIASQYMLSNQLDSAILYFEYALLSAKLGVSPLYISSAYNNIGMYYVVSGQWEKSFGFYQLAITTLQLRNEEDSVFLTSIRDNIADYYFHKGETGKGIDLLKENLNYLLKKSPNKERIYNRVVSYGFRLFDALLEVNQLNESTSIIERVFIFIKNNEEQFLTIEQNIKAKRLLNELAKARNNKQLEEVLCFEIDSLMQVQVIQLLEENNVLKRKVGKFMLHSASKEIQYRKEKNKDAERNEKLILFLIIVITAFSLLVILFMFRVRKAR
ncbi:MAG: hypothetical protein JKY48_04095, partial [Flavobacteriales bacterium]|nr:hypothetical protein [Flavobacteriales bacterium]